MKQITMALLLGAGASVASADSLSLTYTGKSGQSAYTNFTSRFVGGSMFYADGQGQSFEAFCVEPTQGHAVAADGAVSYVLSRFDDGRATLLQGLFSSSFGSLSTGYERGAFQMAVWEIVTESGAALDLAAGDFKFRYLSRTSSASANQDFAALATSYLTAAAAYSGPALYDIQRLSNGGYQDLVLATAVPEPGTYALLLGGLGLVGWAKRRRVA